MAYHILRTSYTTWPPSPSTYRTHSSAMGDDCGSLDNPAGGPFVCGNESVNPNPHFVEEVFEACLYSIYCAVVFVFILRSLDATMIPFRCEETIVLAKL